MIPFNVQEVLRIKAEHPDDNKCIVNDRVKGRLKVTRAFGAGYLKQVIQYQIE
jgi:Protein phosphatase 2C